MKFRCLLKRTLDCAESGNYPFLTKKYYFLHVCFLFNRQTVHRTLCDYLLTLHFTPFEFSKSENTNTSFLWENTWITAVPIDRFNHRMIRFAEMTNPIYSIIQANELISNTWTNKARLEWVIIALLANLRQFHRFCGCQFLENTVSIGDIGCKNHKFVRESLLCINP